MSTPPATARSLPDIANEARPAIAGQLDWVGMGDIELPVRIAGPDGGPIHAHARVTAYVNLQKPEVRGIHMSRLYLLLDRLLGSEVLTPCSVRRVLREFVDSHAELSSRALLRVAFDYMVRRPALVSDNSGWKSYPVVISGLLDRGQFSIETAFEVTYSSTCPCSAALARQVIQEQFQSDFSSDDGLDYERVLAWLGSERGIAATPHSQRSGAEVRVRLLPSFDSFPLVALIDRIEEALKTPVQTAVKREDEQAFARLNAQNLMFCEDAARRMQKALDADERIADFWVRASHFESLHPHNAVAIATKGIANGYNAGMDWVGDLQR
ncbi:MAG: GTP cyclohydrolase I FolE2 [Xanthomonadales bacterium]|nr:GTP cyclohydrolase I FolE2 [Xanthomonadales bacterium]